MLSQTDKDNSGGLDKTELRAAVALWYPTVYNRRKIDDLLRGKMAGRKRKAMAAQVRLSRIFTLYCRSSTLYQIYEGDRCLNL